MGRGGARGLRLRARRLCRAFRRASRASGGAPGRATAHPRLAICSACWRRGCCRFDLVLLAGLDETVWPPRRAPTPSSTGRCARRSAFRAPERRIGQTAHDFVAALGARRGDRQPRAKARRRADRRLALPAAHRGAVAGEAALREARARRDYLGLRARSTGRRPTQRDQARRRRGRRWRCGRSSLSVTRIETLRRDPYAIYAERILRLRRWTPIGAALWAARDRHAMARGAERLRGALPRAAPLPTARARLSSGLAARALCARCSPIPRFARCTGRASIRGLNFYLDFERGRRAHRRAHARREGGRA